MCSDRRRIADWILSGSGPLRFLDIHSDLTVLRIIPIMDINILMNSERVSQNLLLVSLLITLPEGRLRGFSG